MTDIITMLGDSTKYTPYDYTRYIGKDDPTLIKILDIFKEGNNPVKKDYYYIFVKRDIDNTWGQYIKVQTPIDTEKLMIDEQHIYDYQCVYMVDTKHNTLDIQSVKIYYTKKNKTEPLLNLNDIQNGFLSDLVKQIQNYLRKKNKLY